MFEYFEAERARKKAMSAAEKKELKRPKDEAEAKYTTCLLDGRKEKVGNFRVEPPGLFRGRGEHPKKGSLKVKSPLDVQFRHIFILCNHSIGCAPKISLSILVRMHRYLFLICPANGKMWYTTTP
jgi:hypothetical protein